MVALATVSQTEAAQAASAPPAPTRADDAGRMLTPDGRTRVRRGGIAAAPLYDIGGPPASTSPEAPADVSGPAGPSQPPAPPGKPPQPEDVQQQGSVVAVFDDPVDPLIVLAVDHGYLTVRLRCGSRCPAIHPGDYVIAEGQSRSEAVFDAMDIWIVSP